MPLPFTLHPYRRFPVPCSVASNAVPVYVLGRYRFWFRYGVPVHRTKHRAGSKNHWFDSGIAALYHAHSHSIVLSHIGRLWDF